VLKRAVLILTTVGTRHKQKQN